jgi:hypothetical protein
MRRQLVILAAAALLMGSGAALAQTQTPRGNDTSGAPTSSYPGVHPQSTTPDRPPAAAIPEANKPSPESIGQAPAASEKMEPGMDTAGGAKTAPGEENK